jgi:hypothetical protein
MGRKFSRKNFQRDFTVEPRVIGQIHLAHAALANLRADFVTVEFGADWDHFNR